MHARPHHSPLAKAVVPLQHPRMAQEPRTVGDSVPLELPDRLVQVAVATTAATVHAAALGWSGVGVRWAGPAVALTALLWGYEARRNEGRRAWVAAVASLVLGTGLALALGGLRVFGAMLFAGVGTSIAWALVGGLRRATLVEGALDRLERLSLRAGISLALAGTVAVAAPSALPVVLGVGAWVMAGAVLGWALVRDRRRARFFRALYAGDVATHRISSDDDARGLEHLPPLLSGTLTDAVLVANDDGVETYRGGTARRPVARCQRDKRDALAVLERRGSLLVATLGVMLGVTPLAIGAHVRLASPPAPVALAAAAPVVTPPTCAEARPYFREALPAAVHGVGRAVLLTSEQDPTIAPGTGVLLLVPENGGSAPLEMRGAALSWAKRVPCRDKLSLDVGDPSYRPMTIAATVMLDGLVAKADVEREIRETVSEMFERDGRAVRVEHVDFGSEEKTFGYGVRYALRHVPGVKSVKVELNGRDGDEPMGPRDYPVLESFSLDFE